MSSEFDAVMEQHRRLVAEIIAENLRLKSELAQLRLELQRPENVPAMMPCMALGEHHNDKCNGGRIQCSNAQFTEACPWCDGSGIEKRPNV